MSDLSRLRDEDLRAALFDALVERLDAKAHEDPSITVVNRMPTVFALSRRGHLLTLSQGIGLSLLRGDLKWKDRREKPRMFNVGRATVQSRLAIMPDRIEGTPDETVDRIVMMFLDWTAAREESQPAAVEPLREGRPAPLTAAPQSQPAPRPAPQESRPSSHLVPQERPTARVPQRREAMQERQEVTTPPLRTYQLLFETAWREFGHAKALPASSTYSLISAGVFVALTAEAFLNDLGSRVIPSWSQLQRLDPREKAEMLSIELFNHKVDWSVRPFQSVAAALGFRRALAHAHAETLSSDDVRSADRKESEVPRTRRTAWQEHCDVTTIQRWITDVHLLIEHFSKAHDPT